MGEKCFTYHYHRLHIWLVTSKNYGGHKITLCKQNKLKLHALAVIIRLSLAATWQKTVKTDKHLTERLHREHYSTPGTLWTFLGALLATLWANGYLFHLSSDFLYVGGQTSSVLVELSKSLNCLTKTAGFTKLVT